MRLRLSQIVEPEEIVGRHSEMSANAYYLLDVRLVLFVFPATDGTEIHLQEVCKLLLGEILLLAELADSLAVHISNSNYYGKILLTFQFC